MKKPVLRPNPVAQIGAPFLNDQNGDGRLSAPSAARNAAPIMAVLEGALPRRGDVLELASGTGQHIVEFAKNWPELTWQATDIDAARLASIAAWVDDANLANLPAPKPFDAVAGWSALERRYDFIYVVNLLHLIPEDEAAAAVAGMAGALNPCGKIMIYGPFRTDGEFRSPADEAFDAKLREAAPGTGYKDAEWVGAQMAGAGLMGYVRIDMPANNLIHLATVSETRT